MSFIKKIFSPLFRSDLKSKENKNSITKIDFDAKKVQVVTMPNIKNKSFIITKWFFKLGSTIQENSIICELENESMTIEFESFVSGKLVEITTKKGKIHQGEEICKIEKF